MATIWGVGAAVRPRGHLGPLLALGLPLVGSQLAQYAIGLTDTIMLGWYGVEALAAGTLGHAIFFLFFVAGIGVAWAVMPLAAAAHAAGDPVELRRVTRMGLWIATGYGAAVLPLLLWSGPLLSALGQPPRIAALTQDYLRIAGWAILPGLWMMVLRSTLAALERTGIVLWATLGAAALNAVLNYALIFGRWGAPEMGVSGAALASLVVHAAGFAVFAVYADRAFRGRALFARLWRADGEALVRVFRLSWPISLSNLSEVSLFSGAAVMMGWLGTLPLAAHGIVMQLVSAAFMVHLGLSQAATVRAGQAFGRRDGAALRAVGRTAVAVSVSVALATVALFLAMPQTLVGLFLAPEAEARAAILATGTTILALGALFQLADGGQVIALGLLRGLQDTRVPMLLAAFGYWVVGIPAGYVLAFAAGLGPPGVWMGMTAGLAVAATLLMRRFLTKARAI